MVKASIVEKAIELATARTQESDEAVKSTYLEVNGGDAKKVTFSALLSASQALLTGDTSLALGHTKEIAPYATWGSWIEGVPFAHAVLLNEGIIVDLIPCKSEADFIATYRCHPRQFMEITRAMVGAGREIYFNFRNFDPSRKETLDAYKDQPDSLDQIFVYALQAGQKRFYVNSARLPYLLSMFDSGGVMARWEQLLGGAGKIATDNGLFSKLVEVLKYDDRLAIRTENPGAFVRGNGGLNQLPSPIQMFKRIVYHLTFSGICSEIPRNSHLEALANKIIQKMPVERKELLNACSLANELHHTYTAPLTGAYGGTYNLTEAEFEPDEFRPKSVVTQTSQQSFLEFIYGTMANKIRVKDGRLETLREVSGAISLMQNGQAPDDRELRDFMSFMPESRSFLRKRTELMAALNDSVRRSGGDFSNVDSLISETEKAFKVCNSIWRKLGRSLFIGGGMGLTGSAFGVIAAPIGLITNVAHAVLETAKPAGDKAAETVMEKAWDRVVDKRNDRKQIVRILEDVRG